MSKSAYRYLKEPTGVCGCLLVSEGDYWHLSVPMYDSEFL